MSDVSKTCLVLVAFLVATATGAAKQPNILFILADDLGWNDVSYHGSEIRTPNIDKLALEGIKLENYYVQPICSPTRTQLLSGMYQIHTGLQHFIIQPPQPSALPLEFPTIADRLKDLGYATHMIGKWHAGFFKKEYTPTHRGFDTYFGYLLDNEDYYTRQRCYSYTGKNKTQKMCGFDFHENDRVAREYVGNYSTPMFAKRAVELMENHTKTTPDKPLFMYLPFQAVHTPLQAPQEYMDMYTFINSTVRRTYAAMTTCMDDAIATVVDGLKKNGIWENTIIIFSTDNGGDTTFAHSGNNYPLRGGKATLWEGGMRGIGWLSGPALPRAGITSLDLLHVTDWYLTMIKMAGGDTTRLKVDGHDAWDTLSKGTPSPRNEILHNIDPLPWGYNPNDDSPPGAYNYNIPHNESHYHAFQTTFNTSVRAALRMGKWKIITGYAGPGKWVPPPGTHRDEFFRGYQFPEDPPGKHLWLFDLETDPLETTDLSDRYPNQVSLMLARLSYYNSTAVPVNCPPYDPKADPALHGGAWIPWMD